MAFWVEVHRASVCSGLSGVVTLTVALTRSFPRVALSSSRLPLGLPGVLPFLRPAAPECLLDLMLVDFDELGTVDWDALGYGCRAPFFDCSTKC